MILLENVTFGYGPRPVLKNTSLSIGEDERVAILGGSGEGKTTILKLMLGLIRPDSGRIVIDGTDITEKTEDELRRGHFSIHLMLRKMWPFASGSLQTPRRRR